MKILLGAVILAAFSVIGEERKRSTSPEPIATLPAADPLASDEINTPQTIERRSSFQALLLPKPKPKPPQTPISRASIVIPEPALPSEEPALPKRVLIHNYVASKPIAATKPAKTPATQKTSHSLPYGTLIPCQLINAVTGGQGNAPIIAVTTEDIRRNESEIIIPEGTSIHGTTGTVKGDRLQAQQTWHFTLNGTSHQINATLLDRNIDSKTNRFTFGTLGLKGKRLDRPHRHTPKIFAATAIAGASRSLKSTTNGIFGNTPDYSPANAGIEGGAAVADRHADQLLQKSRDIKPEIVIEEGSTFYLYYQVL